jgi:hypothetical protein
MAFWAAAMPIIQQAIPAVLGAIAGGQKSSTSASRQILEQTQTGTAGANMVMQNLPQMQQFVNLGPGEKDVKRGLGAQRGLADMLQSYAQGGFMPTQADWTSARQFATDAFAPQAVAMKQGFQQQEQRTAQLAARMGRGVNDPILQARLAQEQMQAGERLGAQQSAYSSQFAQAMPGQRLGYMQNLAQVRQGLATQAMTNREALIRMGSQLEAQGQQFQLGGAGVTQTGGGGQAGAISGFLAGAGGLMGMLGKAGDSTSGDTGGYKSGNPTSQDYYDMYTRPGTSVPGGGAFTGAARTSSPSMSSYSAPSIPAALSPNYTAPNTGFNFGYNYNMPFGRP